MNSSIKRLMVGVVTAATTLTLSDLTEAATIEKQEGGTSMTMRKTRQVRELTHAEVIAMRKQRAVHDRIMERKKNKSGWFNGIRQWFGLYEAAVSETAMPVLNYSDETYTVRITVDETPNAMWAIVDTAMAHTVLETTSCASCGSGTINTASGAGGLTVSGTAASGTLNNPASTYSGFEGTATFCIFETGDYSTAPTSVNVASMPCIQNFNVHWANSVTTPNTDAVAYLGMALGKGADSSGNTPASTSLLMDQFVTASRLASTDREFALAITSNDANGRVEASTSSKMDFGSRTTNLVKIGTNRQTLQFNDNEFYWKTSLDGIMFGGTERGKWGYSGRSITLDTARQCLYAPADDYPFILETLLDYSTGYYFSTSGDTVVDCQDIKNMQKIQLLMGGKWVEILQADYIVDIQATYNSAERDTGACRICLKQSWDSDWHIGTSMLAGYYADFDFDARQVGLQPLSTSSKIEVVAGTTPDRVLGTNTIKVVSLSVGIGLVTTAFIVLCILMSNKKRLAQARAPKIDDQLNQLENLIQQSLGRKKDSQESSDD